MMNKLLFKIFLFLLLIAVSVSNTNSQLRTAGIYFSADYLFNIVQEGKYPFPFGNIRTLNFVKKNSIGWSAGLKFNYKIDEKLFAGTRLGYARIPFSFNSVESINLVKDGKTIKDQINSDIKSYFDRLNASVEIGYDYNEIVSLSFGTSLSFALDNKINYRQSLQDNENYRFLNLISDSTIGTNRYSNVMVSPFVRINLIPGYNSFKSKDFNGFIPSADISYSYPINSLTKEFNWKYSQLSIGFSFAYSFEKLDLHKNLQYDTVYFRDTSVYYDRNRTKDTIYLKSIYSSDKRIDGKYSWLIEEVHEKWEKRIPKPKPLLNGELDARFVYENGLEATECKLNYITLINNWSYFDYSVKKKSPLITLSDTSTTYSLPILRFYPKIYSEIGLYSLKITLMSDKDTLNSYFTKTYPIKSVEFDMNKLIKTISNDLQNKIIKIFMTLYDKEYYRFESNTGTINFSKLHKDNSIVSRNFLLIDQIRITSGDFKKLTENCNSIINLYGDEDNIKMSLLTKIKKINDNYTIMKLSELKKIIPIELYRDDLIVLEIAQ